MLAHSISRLMGVFANKQFPHPIQKTLNNLYVGCLGLDMHEFEKPCSYSSLEALFTRELVIKRELSSNKLICPTDSFVMAQGKISGNMALQIKNKSYFVDEFLGVKDENLENGEFVNFYLSPKDYHRYHSPCDMQILSATYIPGELFPVNRPALNFVRSLFARNERVVLKCKYENAIFWLVFVGALNVGKMKCVFDERIQTNAKATTLSRYEYENLNVKKGDLLGWFELGSTVVALFPSGFMQLKNLENTKVSFGQGLSID